MAFIVEVPNAALTGAGAVSELATLSLHSGDPGSTGANEITGADYQRQSLTWPGADSGATQVAVSFAVDGGTSVDHVGFWDTGGAWRGGFLTDAPETWNNPGTADVTVTVTAD